jgi:hypothetical protein
MRHRVWMCVTFYDQIQGEFGKEENPIFGSYSNLTLPSVPFRRSRDLDGRREKIAFIDSHMHKISSLADPLAMPSPPEAQPELLPRLQGVPFLRHSNAIIVCFNSFRLGNIVPNPAFQPFLARWLFYIVPTDGAMTTFQLALELLQRVLTELQNRRERTDQRASFT